jgi:hypothetical protein
MTVEERKEFAEEFSTYFTSAENAPSLEDEQWEILAVNVGRLRDEADASSLQDRLSGPRYTKALVELLARWLGLPVHGNVSKEDLVEAVTEKIIGDVEDDSTGESLLFLLEFERQKRENAVFSFANYFLPQQQFSLLNGRLQKDSTKRFAFIFAVFLRDPSRLRSLMLYNQLERAGTVRHRLDASPDPDGDSDAREIIEEVQQDVRFDILTTGQVDEALADLEARSGKAMKCFDVFTDIEEECDALVFILRMKGETRIRQIDTVVFEEEAELFVMRFVDGVKTVDTHPRRPWDRPLSNAVIQGLAEDERLEYVPTRVLTRRESLREFLEEITSTDDTTASADKPDHDLKPYQLKLENAPIGENPILELRSDEKEESLASAVEEIQELGVDLLTDLNDIESFGVTYRDENKEKRYIFTVDVEPHSPQCVSLSYSDSHPPRSTCSEFEDYMEDNYDIHVFPGD